MSEPRLLTTRVLIEELQYPAVDIVLLMADILSNHRTGSLRINFCDGSPLGTVEWTQRTPKGLDTFGLTVLPSSTGETPVSG